MKDNTWEIVINKLFSKKEQLIVSFLKEGKIVKFDETTRELHLAINKEFLVKILTPKLEKFKLEFENYTDVKIKILWINDKLFLMETIKATPPSSPSKTFHLSKNEDIDAVDYSTIVESTLEDVVSTNESSIEDENEDTINLIFKNYFIDKIKVIQLPKKLLEIEELKRKSISLSIFIIPLFIYIPLIKSRKKQLKNVSERVKNLKELNFYPTNDSTKKYIKKVNNMVS